MGLVAGGAERIDGPPPEQLERGALQAREAAAAAENEKRLYEQRAADDRCYYDEQRTSAERYAQEQVALIQQFEQLSAQIAAEVQRAAEAQRAGEATAAETQRAGEQESGGYGGGGNPPGSGDGGGGSDGSGGTPPRTSPASGYYYDERHLEQVQSGRRGTTAEEVAELPRRAPGRPARWIVYLTNLRQPISIADQAFITMSTTISVVRLFRSPIARTPAKMSTLPLAPKRQVF